MSLADAMIDPDLFEEREDIMAAVQPKFEPKFEPKLEKAEREEDMDDLFGDGDDEVEQPQHQRSSSPAHSASGDATREGSEALSAAELQHRRNLEYEEDEGQEENVVELKHAVLSIPNIPIPRSSDSNNWVIRMPNFVKLDSKPFDKDTYVGPDQIDNTLSGNAAEVREKSMSIKLEVENTIRWRWKRTGPDPNNVERQSNSRIIRWSDGTMSLLLGKEIFDIHQAYEGAAQQTPRPGAGSLSQSNSQSQILSQSQGPSGSQGGQQVPPTRTNGLTYLVAQHKRPGILQAEVPITGHMTLRPTGMQSETHRMLARAVGQKHSKVARLRLAPDPTVAPELAQIEAMKAAASVRKPRQPRRPPGYGSPLDFRKKRSSFGGRRRGESVWESDEEPEATFGDSEEEEEEGYGGGRRGTRSGAGGDGKRGAGEYQTDDFLVADSSEEGDEGDSDHGGRKKSKKRKSRDAGEGAGDEMDDLEAIDARIAQQEEESRRRKKREHSGASAGDEAAGEKQQEQGEPMDVDMDVESEEDEDEEVTVRRTGGGSRRKRAIALEEEEEE